MIYSKTLGLLGLKIMLFFLYILNNLMYAYPGCLFSVRYHCLSVCLYTLLYFPVLVILYKFCNKKEFR